MSGDDLAQTRNRLYLVGRLRSLNPLVHVVLGGPPSEPAERVAPVQP
jgi:hypothetical protein